MKSRDVWTKAATFKDSTWKDQNGMEKKIVWTTRIQKS